MKPIIDLIFYNDRTRNGIAIGLIASVFVAGIYGGKRIYRHNKKFEEETRQAKSKPQLSITNENILISNNILRINADGTNYNFYLEYKR